jgi:hypothetical protein
MLIASGLVVKIVILGSPSLYSGPALFFRDVRKLLQGIPERIFIYLFYSIPRKRQHPPFVELSIE